MSICRLMISDFMCGTGRFDPDDKKRELYDKRDVEKGLIYAEGWMEDGVKVDVVDDFQMADLAKWCRKKLKNWRD